MFNFRIGRPNNWIRNTAKCHLTVDDMAYVVFFRSSGSVAVTSIRSEDGVVREVRENKVRK